MVSLKQIKLWPLNRVHELIGQLFACDSKYIIGYRDIWVFKTLIVIDCWWWTIDSGRKILDVNVHNALFTLKFIRLSYSCRIWQIIIGLSWELWNRFYYLGKRKYKFLRLEWKGFGKIFPLVSLLHNSEKNWNDGLSYSPGVSSSRILTDYSPRRSLLSI